MKPKTRSIKEKKNINYVGFIRIPNFCSLKDIKIMKGKPQTGGKHLQIIYLKISVSRTPRTLKTQYIEGF